MPPAYRPAGLPFLPGCRFVAPAGLLIGLAIAMRPVATRV